MMQHLIDIAFDWAMRCFGIAQMNDPYTRSLRVGEEAMELMQACYVEREKMHQMVDIVCDRAVGEVHQEIGGVLMTIFLFVAGVGHHYRGNDPTSYFVTELRRVLAKPPKHFEDRNAEKIALGLGPAPLAPSLKAVYLSVGREEDCLDNEEGA